MTCPTGKIEYCSQVKAQRTADRANLRQGINLKVYGCPHCLFFHLTSKAQSKLETLGDLRRIANAQQRQMDTDTRRRLNEIGKEIKEEMENVIARAFMDYIDRWEQRKTLEELGFKL